MKVGEVVTINGTTFVVLKIVKCVKFESETNALDYMRVGECYPVILVNDINEKHKQYLIIDRFENKHYFDADYFEVVDTI